MQALWDEQRRRNKRWEAMTPEQQKAALNSAEEKEWNRRASLIFPLWSPIARSLAVLLGGLTSSQWSALLQDGELVFSTDPKRNELRLPEEIARTFRSSRPGLNPPEMYSPGEPETEQRMHQWEQDGQAEWAAATGYRVKIELNQLEILQGGALSLNASAAPIRDVPYVVYGAPFGAGNVLGAAIYVNARPADLQPLNDVTARHAGMEQDPVLGVKKTFTTTAQPRPMNGIPEIAWRWWLRDLLPVLARTYDVQFISDAYWSHAAQAGVRSAATEPTALYTLLDGAPSMTHDWEHRGRLIRLRSRTWFLDRPREIPLRLVRRWRELYQQFGSLPLREYVQMASDLDDGKLLALDDIASQVGIPADVRDFYMPYASRHIIRLYSSLGAAQRQSLWSGKSLPVAQMSPSQRALFFAILSDINHGRTPPLDLTQAGSGTLALQPTPFVRVIARRKGAFSLKEENLPEGSTAAPPAPGGAQSGAEARPGAASQDEVRRYPVTRLWFVYQCGPKAEERNLLWIATPGSSPAAGEP
jgi:hypothetical protein